MHNRIILLILSMFMAVDAALIYLVLTISPIKLKRNTFTFQYGEEIPVNVDEYVNATDSVLENVTLDLSQVSTEVGTYTASVQYFNHTESFQIVIVDTVQPKVQLKQIEWTIDIGETIYAADLIETVEDYSDTTVYFYDEETEETSESKTYTSAGSHVERIIVIDSHGNQSTSLRVKITVQSNQVSPQISGIADITISLGTDFDPLSGVSVTDDIDGDLTDQLIVSGAVNIDAVGVYSLTYTVSDSDGNTTKIIRKVSVVDDN